jgi:peptide deformylase
VLRIVTHPHPALRFDSVPVRQIDDTLRAHVRAMFDLMYEAKGIGLAANQVALPFRFFILNITGDSEQKDQEQVFINPEIIKRHSSAIDEEGCLSFPGLYGPVPRAKRIRVRAYDLHGNEVLLDAEDLHGRAIQHEADHVAGRLFIDYFDADTRKTAEPKLREIERLYRAEQSEGRLAADEQLLRELRVLAGLDGTAVA